MINRRGPPTCGECCTQYEDGTVSAYPLYEQMTEGVDDYDIRLRTLAEAPRASFRSSTAIDRYVDRRSSRCCSMRHTVGRFRDAFDLPDLPGEGDDVCGGPDELERGR